MLFRPLQYSMILVYDLTLRKNSGPYIMMCGDSRGDIFGRDYRNGKYTISAQIFSKVDLKGNLVVDGTSDFRIQECDRRLRGSD